MASSSKSRIYLIEQYEIEKKKKKREIEQEFIDRQTFYDDPEQSNDVEILEENKLKEEIERINKIVTRRRAFEERIKPHQCEVCSERFQNIYKLRTHKEKNHKKSFKCDKCNRCYNWYSGLRQHSPAGIYLLKVNNRNTRTRCVICSKLTIKIPERRH